MCIRDRNKWASIILISGLNKNKPNFQKNVSSERVEGFSTKNINYVIKNYLKPILTEYTLMLSVMQTWITFKK